MAISESVKLSLLKGFRSHARATAFQSLARNADYAAHLLISNLCRLLEGCDRFSMSLHDECFDPPVSLLHERSLLRHTGEKTKVLTWMGRCCCGGVVALPICRRTHSLQLQTRIEKTYATQRRFPLHDASSA